MNEIVKTHTPLPCPFCGGEASADGHIAYSPNYDAEWADGTKVRTAYFCNCIRCGVRNGEHQTKSDALAKWNARTGNHDDLLALAHQYASDLRTWHNAESVERRLERIAAVLAKVGDV